MRTILMIDRDLGFVFWLGQALDKSGYQVLPAKSVKDASALLSELNIGVVDLVIVSMISPDAFDFIQALRVQQGHLEVIALLEEWEEPDPLFEDIRAWRRKPVVADEAAKIAWINAIQRVLLGNTTAGNLPASAPGASV